ncbi:Uncharacterised protein [Candidatus Norongarragalina meridionalis]|nr:Uncharacterised protein [Candidatus Norongarragalina meridionalis]
MLPKILVKPEHVTLARQGITNYTVRALAIGHGLGPSKTAAILTHYGGHPWNSVVAEMGRAGFKGVRKYKYQFVPRSAK